MEAISALRIFLSGTAARGLAAIDPLHIATNAEEGVTVTGEYQNGFLGLLNFNYLYYFLRREVFIWAAIITLCLLIAMMFVSKAEKISDRKNDILHKLFIVFLASSALFILSTVVQVLDWIF